MCNHAYSAGYAKRPGSMGERCPYPEFYDKVGAAAASAPGGAPGPVLPLDAHGVCIFHSREIDWKRKNDFGGEFCRLVRLLDADGSLKYYDFAEFVFIGGQVSAAGRSEEWILRITDTAFREEAVFTGASFLDSLDLEDVDFQNGATFDRATFARDLKAGRVRFRGLDFNHASFARHAFFTDVESVSYTLFGGARFTFRTDGYAVKFENSRFHGITDFSHAGFALGEGSTAAFLKVQFEDFTDFTGTRFNCQIVFADVTFAAITEFTGTSFEMVGSSARYRGAAVEFKRVEVRAGAVLSFTGTDPQNRMFTHDVLMTFKDDPAGTICFENVNFNRIQAGSRLRLTQLAKAGRVEIGPGCIKYRFQTDVRTISVSRGNAPLVVELCQTFTNYFTASNGFNLGFEIVERDAAKVSFFYFTDEDVSDGVFLQRLAQTEQGLWNLLSIGSAEQLLSLEGVAGTGLPTRRESAIINAVDGVSALLGTFFRVGVRIAFGAWKEADTRALLGAIRFNDGGAENRALDLHRLLVEKYTGRALFGLNHQQNELLPPIAAVDRESGRTAGRVKVLFLGSNSLISPLEIDREIREIQINLKLARERDNLDLKAESAVTIDTLTQAMLDESPTIVHFSGHGLAAGIILQDETGAPKVVSSDALASLFGMFRDTVRCVVLNCCYSEPQARAIRQHVPHVVGTRSPISDLAAVAFSTGFYKALGAGMDIPFSFAMGETYMKLEGVFVDDVLVLL